MSMTQLPAPTPDPSYSDYRHEYLRISSQGNNRLQVSTFLAGLTGAAFIALLATDRAQNVYNDILDFKHHPSLAAWIGPDLGAIGRVGAEFLLGCSTLFFMLASVGTYAAMQRVADLRPSTVDGFKDSTVKVIDSSDKQRLTDAYRAYRQCTSFIPCGLVLLLLSLPLTGFYIGSLFGYVMSLLLLALCVRTRTSWGLTLGIIRNRSTELTKPPQRSEQAAPDPAANTNNHG